MEVEKLNSKIADLEDRLKTSQGCCKLMAERLHRYSQRTADLRGYIKELGGDPARFDTEEEKAARAYWLKEFEKDFKKAYE